MHARLTAGISVRGVSWWRFGRFSGDTGLDHPARATRRLWPRRRDVSHTLVLNATYEPLCTVPQRRALVLVLARKAVLVEESDVVMHSVTTEAVVPAVVRLNRYVRIPHRGPVPVTRRAIFARDGGRCVYCGAPATSVDHVRPRSRGGRHEWDNVVSACHRCNHVKGDRAVSELGWRMHAPPAPPSGLAWRILGTGRSDPRWVPYLAAFGAEPASATA
jgi:5-methylcytosine-specific restriction endonuclease McrA